MIPAARRRCASIAIIRTILYYRFVAIITSAYPPSALCLIFLLIIPLLRQLIAEIPASAQRNGLNTLLRPADRLISAGRSVSLSVWLPHPQTFLPYGPCFFCCVSSISAAATKEQAVLHRLHYQHVASLDREVAVGLLLPLLQSYAIPL